MEALHHASEVRGSHMPLTNQDLSKNRGTHSTKTQEPAIGFDPSQLRPPAISANAFRVLEKRYLAKSEEGKVIETPQELFVRVARNIALAELNYATGNFEKVFIDFYHLMANMEFLPNSPTLMNAGRDLQQLSACFVLPVKIRWKGFLKSSNRPLLFIKQEEEPDFPFPGFGQKMMS